MAKDDIRLIKEALGQEVLANEMRMSSAITEDSTILKEMSEKLAKSILDGIEARGFYAIPDSGKARYIEPDEFLRDQSTMAMKVRAGMRTDPVGFMCLATHMIARANEQADGERQATKEWMGRYTRLMERIASAKSLKQLRTAVSTDENAWL